MTADEAVANASVEAGDLSTKGSSIVTLVKPLITPFASLRVNLLTPFALVSSFIIVNVPDWAGNSSFSAKRIDFNAQLPLIDTLSALKWL